MPKITTNSKGGQIVWGAEDWLSGINQNANADYNYILGRTLWSVSAINPFNPVGTLAPGQLPIDVSNVNIVDSLLLNTVPYAGYAYAISLGGKIFKFEAIITGALENTGIWATGVAITPSSGTAVGEDIINYRIGSTDYAFYSWYTTTQADVGIFNYNATFDDDYISATTTINSDSLVVGAIYRITLTGGGADWTNVGAANNNVGTIFTATGTTPTSWGTGRLVRVLTPSTPLPMFVGSDDILYIGNGNVVHAFDGQTGTNSITSTSGTMSWEVFKLPKNYIVASFAHFEPNLLMVFAYKNNGSGSYFGESKAFVYNYVDEDPVQVIDLNDDYVRGGFNFMGTVGCFTCSRKDYINGGWQSKLQLHDGSKFVVVEGYYGNNTPLNGGIITFPKHILFNIGGNIHFFGKIQDDLNNTIHKIIELPNTTSGLLKNLSPFLILAGSNYSAARLQRFATTPSESFCASADCQTLSVYPPFPSGKRGRLKMMTVEFNKSCSGRALTLTVQPDVNATSGDLFLQKTTVANTDLIQKFTQFQDGSQFPADFYCLALSFTWSAGSASTSAPIINKVIADYEYSDIES
jgi:hypothetical protein